MAPERSQDLCVFRLKAEPWKLNVCYGSIEKGEECEMAFVPQPRHMMERG